MLFRSWRLVFLLLTVMAVAAPARAAAQEGLPEITLHGSASFAWGIANPLPITGLATGNGSSDIRTVNIQFNVATSDRDRFVLQFQHKKLGGAAVLEGLPDVLPLYAFYERRFNDQWTLHAGRNPLPSGLFNEIRYLGTLVPGYSAPRSTYGETLENLDGLVLTRHTALPAQWRLTVDAMAGGFDARFLSTTPDGKFAAATGRFDGLVGTQWTVESPDRSFRALLHASDFDWGMRVKGARFGDGRERILRGGVEWVRPRGFLRTEVFKADNRGRSDPGATFRNIYGQAGIRVAPRVELVYQQEFIANHSQTSFTVRERLTGTRESRGIVRVPLSPTMVAKLEAGERVGYNFEVTVPIYLAPRPGEGYARVAPPSSSRFLMLSMALVF